MLMDEGVDNFSRPDNRDVFEIDDDQASLQLKDWDDRTDTEPVMMDGENMSNEQIKEEIKRIKAAHAKDEEFPDEVDMPLDIPARKRFAKYRGLKSFRTSSWDPKESLPPEYGKIFAFDNFGRTRKHVLAKALEMDAREIDGSLPTGSYARLYINEVPADAASNLCTLSKTLPITSCGLLQHESKVSVLHFSIRKHESYADPIKSKEELLFHIRPIFSLDSMNSDKQNMEMFFHEGRFSTASIYAPISFPPLPMIALKTGGDSDSPVLAAVGSLRSIDVDIIILEKIILTG